MKELTERELEILEIIWAIEKGFVNDIIDKIPNPKPPYTTVSSIVRILESKGYVTHKAYGKTHEYTPVVSRIDYKRNLMKGVVSKFFDGSFNKVVSFMVGENQLSSKEADEISILIENLKSKDDDKLD